MAATPKRGRLPLAATCVAMVLAIGATVWPQPSALSIILTGQSMTRSDIRVTAPSAVPAVAAMLKGDVVFTNFEGAVAEPGQPNEAAPQQGAETLAPPVTLDSLKALGFNLLSL